MDGRKGWEGLEGQQGRIREALAPWGLAASGLSMEREPPSPGMTMTPFPRPPAPRSVLIGPRHVKHAG